MQALSECEGKEQSFKRQLGKTKHVACIYGSLPVRETVSTELRFFSFDKDISVDWIFSSSQTCCFNLPWQPVCACICGLCLC